MGAKLSLLIYDLQRSSYIRHDGEDCSSSTNARSLIERGRRAPSYFGVAGFSWQLCSQRSFALSAGAFPERSDRWNVILVRNAATKILGRRIPWERSASRETTLNRRLVLFQWNREPSQVSKDV